MSSLLRAVNEGTLQGSPGACEVAIQLQRLRHSRGVSQLSLALSAGISARHLSFVETGRARPGRDVLLRLGDALELTDDELRSLLAAGGFGAIQAPARAASAAQLAPLLDSIQSLLAQLEPAPAVLIDARWDILMPNAAYVRISRLVSTPLAFPRGALALTDAPRPNRLRELVDPGVRRALQNWPELVGALLSRARADLRLSADPVLQRLVDEVMTTPGAAAACRAAESDARPAFPIRARLRVGRSAIDLFSVVSGWASDRPGLRVEMLHPVDEYSARALRAVCARHPAVAPDPERRVSPSPRIVPVGAGLAVRKA